MTKRLSSKEFFEVIEAIWEEGPMVKYQNPDAWSAPLNLNTSKFF